VTLIDFQSVSKSYNGRPAIADFSLSIAEGERVVILGPSGCGKTTVLRLLAGFLTPDSGSIRIGADMVACDRRNLREPEERNLGMVFQDLALWPHLSVKGNLEFGLRAKHIPSSERSKRIREILHLVEMEEYPNAKPAELSGGQQQRVALARALVLQPKALLMDEPLSNLDQELNQRLRNEILRLHEALGFTLVYVTHDQEESADLGNRVVFMKNGRIERIETATW
jgi:iron(III) transport system ATP-binding protein